MKIKPFLKHLIFTQLADVEKFVFSIGTGGQRSGTLSVFLRLSGSITAAVRRKHNASKQYKRKTVL